MLLDHFRVCAWAPLNDSDSELPLDENYQQCVKILWSKDLWKRNQHVREWYMIEVMQDKKTNK